MSDQPVLKGMFEFTQYIKNRAWRGFVRCRSVFIQITLGLLACGYLSFAHAQAYSPIPKHYGSVDINIGWPPQLFSTPQSACDAMAAITPGLLLQDTSTTLFFGIVVKSGVSSVGLVEGAVPYNTPGLNGYFCYASYRYLNLHGPGNHVDDLYHFASNSVIPVCPPSYTPVDRLPSGADTCPNNPMFFLMPSPPEKGKQCNLVHDPINPASGNMFLSEEDVAGTSSGLSFRRYYNSLDDYGSGAKAGWRHSYGRRIEIVKGPSSYVKFVGPPYQSSQYQTAAQACTSGFAQLQANVPSWAGATVTYANDRCSLSKNGVPQGTVPVLFSYPILPPPRLTVIGYRVYRDDGNSVWASNANGVAVFSPGTRLSLSTTANGFVLIDEHDTTEVYDASGTLLSITSRSGAVLTMSYAPEVPNTPRQLLAVTDAFGHALTLTYDPEGRLSGVTDAAGTTSYGYDTQSRLSTVTHPDTTSRTYLYENASYPTALTGVIDEQAVQLSTWVYDDYGRATSTFEAGGVGAGTLVYHADGSVTDTDALGAVRTFTFDRVGDRNRVTGISGSQLSTCQEGKATTYNTDGWVSSRTDYNNHVTQYTHDPIRGVELSRTEAYGTPRARTITTTWHPTYRLPTSMSIYAGPTATGTPVQTTTFTHDAQGNVLTRTVNDPTANASRTWTYTYNGVGQVLTADGPRTDVSDITTYTYYTCTTGYQCGQVHTITNALGQTTTYLTYNANGQPLTMTDANGVQTTLTYDTRQRLTSRTVNGELTTIEYWPIGQVKKVTLPDESYLGYSYDAAHRLTEVTDSDGNKLVYTLDALGNRTKEEAFDPSNALTQTRRFVFNQLSQLSQAIGAANTAAVTTTFGYDLNGNQTTVNAPLGRNASTQYDELDRVASNTDPLNGVTQYGYNALDQVISVTDPRTLTTNYAYNGLGDLLQQVSPDTGTTNNTFDAAGNLQSTTDARNVTATSSYDALNRITQTTYPDQTINYSYDTGANGVGRLTSLSDASGSTSWTYTSLGRIASKTQAMGSVSKTVSYAYNGAGQLTTLTTPSGKAITYTYANNRIAGIQVNGIPMVSNVLYEPFGPSRGWTWGNGSLAVRVFDTDGKLTHVDSAGLNTYQYDDAFRITGITDTTNGANSSTFNYDLLDRLTSGTKPGQNQTFTYDPNGNRQTQGGTQSSTFTTSTTSNRLQSVTGALSKTYTFDSAGNTLSDGTATFTYTSMGRINTATKASLTTNYAYNALGQRVKKTNSTQTIYFVYDESGHLLGEYDQTGNLIEEIVWLNDTPIATIREGSCGMAIFYIHTDHLNTPRKITKRSTPDIVWRWDSDAFGTTQANENPSGLGTFAFNLRFPGQYFDSETGLYYNDFRYYDPATGKYITSDPIGLAGGLNTYVYVGGNPIENSDPLGLFTYHFHWLMTRSSYGDNGRFDRNELALRVANVDFEPGSQRTYNSYMHAMRAPWWSKEQARKLYDEYIDKEISRCNIAGLARALHAAQDKAAAGHEDFSIWNGGNIFGLPTWSHFWDDFAPSPKEWANAIKNSSDILARFEAKCSCDKK